MMAMQRIPNRLLERLPVYAAFLFAFLIMLPGLSNPFLLDDLSKIVQNPDLRSFWSFFDRILRPYPDTLPVLQRNDPSRPIVFFVYTLLYKLGGATPWIFHLFNATVHAANAALACLLARRFFSTMPNLAGGAASLGVALFYALMPIQVSTANYAYALSDLLSAFFSFLSLYFFLRESPSEEEKNDTIVASLAFAAALACKQSAIALPAVVGVWLFFFPPRPRNGVVRAAWLLAIALAFLAWRTFHLGGIGDLEGRGNTWAPLEYLSIQPYVLWRYLQLTLWPRGLSIDHYLTPNQVPGSVRWIAFLGWAILIVGGLWILRRVRRETRAFILLGVAWYLTWLAPTSSVVPTVDLLVERRTYLANFGICLLIGGLYARAGRRAAPVAFLHLAVLSGLAVRQTLAYATPERAWREVLALYPQSPRATTNLAVWYIGEKRFEEARTLLEAGLAVHPEDSFYWTNLGSVYQSEDYAGRDAKKAEECFARAIELRPQSPEAHYNLARLAQISGRLAEAEKHYRISLGQRPGYAPALNNLGVMALDRGDERGAARFYDEALQNDPTYVPALNNRAKLKVSTGTTVTEIPVDQVPSDLIVKTYEDHLRAHPKDESARRKFREFCAQRKLPCAKQP